MMLLIEFKWRHFIQLRSALFFEPDRESFVRVKCLKKKKEKKKKEEKKQEPGEDRETVFPGL